MTNEHQRVLCVETQTIYAILLQQIRARYVVTIRKKKKYLKFLIYLGKARVFF